MMKFFDKTAPTLKEAQEFVGGYVEPVYLQNGDLMLVNEEGRLRGLDLNQDASNIAGQIIVGPAIVIANEARGENW